MAERNFPPAVEELLRRLSSDRLTGASSLLELAAGCFSGLSSASTAAKGCELVAEVEDLALELVTIQPLMAPFYNLCAAILERSPPSIALPSLKKAVAGAAMRYTREAAKGTELASRAGAGLIKDGARILTISRSTAVIRSLELARKDWKKFSVVVLESRPMLEGRRAAERLAAAGIPVELVVDSAIASEVRRADQVIVGADAITDEIVVNKAGTLALAVAAREFSVGMHAIADSSKLLPNALMPENDRHRNPNEVWDAAPGGVTVRNRYFEKVPLNYFRCFAMENGTVDAKEIARRTEMAGPGLERLAGLLAR